MFFLLLSVSEIQQAKPQTSLGVSGAAFLWNHTNADLPPPTAAQLELRLSSFSLRQENQRLICAKPQPLNPSQTFGCTLCGPTPGLCPGPVSDGRIVSFPPLSFSLILPSFFFKLCLLLLRSQFLPLFTPISFSTTDNISAKVKGNNEGEIALIILEHHKCLPSHTHSGAADNSSVVGMKLYLVECLQASVEDRHRIWKAFPTLSGILSKHFPGYNSLWRN